LAALDSQRPHRELRIARKMQRIGNDVPDETLPPREFRDQAANFSIEPRPYDAPLNGLAHPPMRTIATDGLLGINV
jgi:hypothetical protein